MTEPKHSLSLEELEDRLKAAQRSGEKRESGGPGSAGSMSQAVGLAFRAGVELVAAFVVALGIGWLIDAWLGTRPWFMVVFFFLGAATAYMNVMRLAKGMGLQIGFPKSGANQAADGISSKDQRE